MKTKKTILLKGTGTAPGIGIGDLWRIEECPAAYTPRQVTDTRAEKQRFQQAAAAFCENTERQAQALQATAGKEQADILREHITIVQDPFLQSETDKQIASGQCAEAAVEAVCDRFIALFSAAGDELTEQRSADVRDVKTGLLRQLLGMSEVSLKNVPENTVLCVKEMTPSMMAGLNREHIAGILTETGSKASHSAILAKVMGIPAVMGIPDLMASACSGTAVLLDGDTGEVILSPDEEQQQQYRARRETLRREYAERELFRGKPTVSADGTVYELVCNIGNPQEAALAIENDGEGVGLFRTEFLFMNQTSLPTEEEQFRAYQKAALLLHGKPLVIRTLDIGGDKDIPYLGLAKEDNPFMGFRAIRYCLHHRDLFRTQIRAILRASAFGKVRIMFPLITCVEEVRQGKALVEECQSELRTQGIAFDEAIPVGIMAETAAAGMIADWLAEEADFFSIGTNDLTGYTMAADRGNRNVADWYSVLQPSVLRMIQAIIRAGKNHHIPVGMCGEAAGDPMLIPLLISFGLTEFSVSPPDVLRVRKTIARWTKPQADEVTAKVMSLPTQQEIKEYLQNTI
ncbi:MAG: phosphoenolpyruvate--protein phosphotransferase [Clostridia bacterium]|nr:phosphoenolpyruvate--protein phosphotransferase [Clostridia bacterium]